jgi:hypothetical protein
MVTRTGTPARALGERGGHLLPDLAGPVDVRLERDRFLRRPDGAEHRGEDLRAVLQRGHLVAVGDGRAEHHRHLAAELRIRDGEPMGEMARDRLVGAAETHREEHDDRREEHRQGEHPERVLPDPVHLHAAGGTSGGAQPLYPPAGETDGPHRSTTPFLRGD